MTQIVRKFITDNAINGQKIRLDNNEMLRVRNAANSADINILKVSSADELEFQTQPQAAAALPLPSAPKHYVTVEYIEAYVLGERDPKDAVNVASDSNIALTGTTPLVIDGITAVNGPVNKPFRVLLTSQIDPEDNGIYDYIDAAGSYTLTRSSDFDSDNDVTHGAYTTVVSGTNYSGYKFQLTTSDPITVGTTPLVFVGYPSVLNLQGGDMITKTGNIFSVDLAALSGLESTNPGNVNGQLRVKTDTSAAEKDQTTRRDSVTGAVVAKKSKKHSVTLSPTDITSQYIDLLDVAEQDSVRLAVAGAGDQFEGDDFTVNYTGGASSKTRVTLAGGLGTGGVSALASGDKIVVYYRSF